MTKIDIDRTDASLLGRHVLLALSGGADSVALLFLLLDARAQMRLTISAAHYEHGIRAQAAQDDLAFVRALCRAQNIPLFVGTGDVPGEALRRGMGLEETAREMRYRFLRETRTAIGADVIALAHHMDDQAETVLMHILRGGGLRGAAGMRPAQDDLVRPLLHLRKAQLTAFLTARGQPWREDSTNAVPDTPRNILRILALPQLERAYPGAVRSLSRFSAIARESEDALSALTREKAAGCVRAMPGGYILTGALLHDTACLARAIRALVPGAQHGQITRAAALPMRGAGQLAGGVYAQRTEDALFLTFPQRLNQTEVLLTDAPRVCLPPLAEITQETGTFAPICANGTVQVIAQSALEAACLRTRRPGDFIFPFGLHGHSKPFSDYLADRGIPFAMRDYLPVIARGREIIWVPGIGLSETARTREGAANRRLTCIPLLPAIPAELISPDK